MQTRISRLLPLLFLLATGACGGQSPTPVAASEAEAAPTATLAPDGWATASGDLIDADGANVGAALFQQAPGGVLMRIDLSGLTPGWHGVHFHQTGSCADGADGFKLSGPHVDPADHDHGLLNPTGSEAGDLPNLYAGADGRARAEIFRAGLALNGEGGLLDADGFAVIVHADPDDHQSQPIGGAGARVACAAIAP